MSVYASPRWIAAQSRPRSGWSMQLTATDTPSRAAAIDDGTVTSMRRPRTP
jgi:hypothetical protein